MLFGPVSISRDYSLLSRRLIADSLQERCAIPELARLVRARTPLRRWRLGLKGCDPKLAHALFRNFDVVAELVADLDPGPGGIPVLLRHYLGLGGQVLAFNVDRQFSDVLDGLVVVPPMQPVVAFTASDGIIPLIAGDIILLFIAIEIVV
jgi:hypothetical protein